MFNLAAAPSVRQWRIGILAVLIGSTALLIRAAVFMGQYHDSSYPSQSGHPKAQGVGTGEGWGPGTAIPHGTVQRFNRLPKAWPPGTSSIAVHGEGMNSPWPGYVKSFGYWQVMYRWRGKTPPPKTTYTVTILTAAIVKCSGEFVAASGRAGPPGFIDAHVPAPNRGGFFSDRGQRAVSSVHHDAAGYFLVVTSDPASGEVRQTKQFQRWEGDISAEIEFSQPN